MSDEIKEILSYLKKKENTRNIKCITLSERDKLLDYTTNLQEENDRLNEENKKFNKWIETLNKENHRLNNIINELEKWLEDVDVFQKNFIENKNHITPYRAVLDKLKELKENNNEF